MRKVILFQTFGLALCLYVSCDKHDDDEKGNSAPQGKAARPSGTADNRTSPRLPSAHSSDSSDEVEKKNDVSKIWQAFEHHSPEIIIEALADERSFSSPTSWGMFVSDYGNFLATIDNTETLLSHLRLFTDDFNLPRQLEMIGAESELINPDFLLEMVEALGSPMAEKHLAKGIQKRIEETDTAERRAVAQGFLDADVPREIAVAAIAGVTPDILTEEPETATEWLLSLPDDVASEADAIFVRQGAAGDPDPAISYIQSLFDRPDGEARALYAVRIFNAVFTSKQPAAAYDWALRLPEELGSARVDLIGKAYARFSAVDADLADSKLVSEIPDKGLRELGSV